MSKIAYYLGGDVIKEMDKVDELIAEYAGKLIADLQKNNGVMETEVRALAELISARAQMNDKYVLSESYKDKEHRFQA